MAHSLLFLPDISGFTEFVQSTEAAHSQHVIAELLEILIAANTQNMQLAEVEGDALFFYKENEVPSLEKLLAQVETMFTAFYSHLKLLEKNRVCPCTACSTAPDLQLKIVAHCGDLQFITVQGTRKPFGKQVIEVHRLLKNSVNSDSYALLTKELADIIMLPENYQSRLFEFKGGQNEYDGKAVKYLFSTVDKEGLKLKPFAQAQNVHFDEAPSVQMKREFPVSAGQLLESITNYSIRHDWVEGVDKFEYNENEVTRIGTEHVCVINGQHLDFITVTKEGKPGQLVYGELSTSPAPVDSIYQFYIITPQGDESCTLEMEVYLKARSPLKKLLIFLVVKRAIKKNLGSALDGLHRMLSASQSAD